MTFSREFILCALKRGSDATDSLAATGFSRIITDSRKIQPGDLFVALAGDRYNGHDFAAHCLQIPETAVLVQTNHPVTRELQNRFPKRVLVVPSSLSAYRDLAARWRDQFLIPVIAVAGNVGKTTTKELLAGMLMGLGEPQKVLKTLMSQNGFLGIPMTLLELREHHEFAVVEIGIDAPKSMEEHLEIVRPTHGILTSVGPEHLEILRTEEKAIEEELKLASWLLSHRGMVVLNIGQKPQYSFFQKHAQKHCLGYQLIEKTARPLSQKLKNLALLGKFKPKKDIVDFEKFLNFPKWNITPPFSSQHQVENFVGVASLLMALGFEPSKIKKLRNQVLEHISLWGRSEVTKMKAGSAEVTFLCDFYNSNPASLKAAIQYLVVLAKKSGKRGSLHFCLGDMLELGKEEEKYHRSLATQLRPLGKNAFIWLTGPRMRWLESELKRKKFRGQCLYFENVKNMGSQIFSTLKNGDCLLLKASRGMKFEKIWEDLKRESTL